MRFILGLCLCLCALSGLIAPKTSRPIVLSYNNSQTTSSYTFKFQIETSVPATGILLIYFPVDFAANLGITTCQVVDDKLTSFPCSISHGIVTITPGYLSNSPVDNTYIFTVLGVSNPIPTGMTGHFRLETYSGINLLDRCDTFGQIGIDDKAADLANPIFTCLSGCLTGQVGLYQVGFRAPKDLQPFTRVYLSFPTTIAMKSPPPCISTTHSYMTCSRDMSNKITLGGLYYVISSNSLISITFSDVQNPSYAGVIGTLDIELFQPLVNSLIGFKRGITGPNISPNAINGITVCPNENIPCPGNSPKVSKSNKMVFTISASTTNNIPGNGLILVTFPSSFGTMATGTCQVTSGLNNYGSTADTQVICTVDNTLKRLSITSFAQFNAGSFSLQVQATTPSSSGTHSYFNVYTYMDAAMAKLIDQNENTASTSVGNYLITTYWTLNWIKTGAVVTTLKSGDTVGLNIVFRPDSQINSPNSANIVLIFPSAAWITSASFLSTLQPNQYSSSTTFTITPTGSTVTAPLSSILVNIPSNQDTTLIYASNPDPAGSAVFQIPTQPGNYFIEVRFEYVSGTTTNSYFHWVTVVAPSMTAAVAPLSTDINQKTMYAVTFTPTIYIPASVIPVNTATQWGAVDVQFPTQDSVLNLLWATDLGTGLTSGKAVPCRGISGITYVSGSTIVCTLYPATGVSTSLYATIRVTNFSEILATTPVTFYISNIANGKTGSVQPSVTITTYGITQAILQPLNTVSVAITTAFYDDASTVLPVVNGRSPSPNGDGANVVAFTPNTLNVATVMTFLLWTENKVTTTGSATTSGLILKMPLTYPIPYSGLTCYFLYTTAAPYCYPFPECGWIVIYPLPILTSGQINPHTNYQVTIKGLTNPFNRINPTALSIIPVENNRESEYIYFTNFTPLSLGAVSSVSITCDNYEANHVDTTCTFGFILTNSLAVGSTIVITFPKNSYVLTTVPSPACSISGGLNKQSDSLPLKCTFTANTLTISQFTNYVGGNAISVRVDHILNPLYSGITDVFNIESFSQNSLLQDGTYSISGLVILSKAQVPSLTHNAFWAVPSNGYATGVSVTVSFTPIVSIPAMSVIKVIYPLEYAPIPTTPVCGLSGALTTITSCSSDGSTVLTVITDTKYDISATQSPLNVTISGMKNFAPGITSGLVTVSIFCSDQLVTESSSDPANRKFTTELQSGVLSVKSFDFDPQTAGEEAMYNFTLAFNTTFSSKCQLQITFPPVMPRGLNQFIGCTSYQLSSKASGEMDCYVTERTVIINGTAGWINGKSPSFVNVTVRRITNPNVGQSLTTFTVATMCGNGIKDVGVIQNTFQFVSTPAAMFYDNSTIDSNACGYTSTIGLEVQSSRFKSKVDDVMLVTFPSAYIMEYVANSLTCESNLTTSTPDQYAYYKNQLIINGFPDQTDITSFIYTVKGLENPYTLGELPFVATAWHRPSTRQVVAKTASNLNRVLPFTFKKIGKDILVNYNLPWTVNVGTWSDEMYVTLQSNSPTSFQLTPAPIPGLTILPNPISFVLGQSIASFHMSASQGLSSGFYNMTWSVSGSWQESIYAPVKRSFFQVTNTRNESISIQDPGIVPQGGSSVPLAIKLSRSPASLLNLTFIQLGSIPTKMNFSVSTISFKPGQTMKVFQILISNESYGTEGEFFVVKTGADASTFQLAKSTYTFQVGETTSNKPEILDSKVVKADRNSVLIRLLTNEIVKVFHMTGYYGTRAPSFQELVSGSFQNTTAIKWLPLFNSTTDYEDQTTQFQYSIELQGLTAGTTYTFFAMIQDTINNIGNTVVNFNFTTSQRFQPAYCIMKFYQAPLGDDFRKTISSSLASILGIKSTLIEAIPTDNTTSSVSSAISDSSDAPISTTSSGGARVLLATSYATVYILSDPTDPSDIEPLQLINSLNDKRLLIKSLLPTYDDSVIISALQMTANKPSFLLQAKFVSTMNGDLVLGDLALIEPGFIYLCFVADSKIPITPTSFQVMSGVDAANSPCFINDFIAASKTAIDYRKAGLPDSKDFWVFLTASNWLTMSPELLPDSQVASIGFTTRGIMAISWKSTVVLTVLVATSVTLSKGLSSSGDDGLGEVEWEFRQYVERYGKTYASEEERRDRMTRFAEVRDEVSRHNSANTMFQLEVNELADRSREELRETHFRTSYKELHAASTILPTNNLPLSVDWNASGGVSPVLNQGTCGGCWAYSATGAIEGLYFIQNKTLISLSPQQLIDCSMKYGNEGCNGGNISAAFQYVMGVGGIESLKNYPVKAFTGLCWANPNRFAFSIHNYTNVPSNNELQLKAAVARQPVSVLIEADQSSFMFYHSGVITTSCGTTPNHGVLVVGYGEENGVSYWLIKNSWGTSWGIGGFGKILREDANNQTPGMCGIALSPSYPL